jgi:hypothetical protein
MIRLLTSLLSEQQGEKEMKQEDKEVNEVEENIPLSTHSFGLFQNSTQQQRK